MTYILAYFRIPDKLNANIIVQFSILKILCVKSDLLNIWINKKTRGTLGAVNKFPCFIFGLLISCCER